MTTTLITGIPRSGTTFVCARLNLAPDCIALAEPMAVPQHGDVARALDEIVDFVDVTRARLLTDGVAPSKTVDGVIADNFFEDLGADGELRRTRERVINVNFDKPLSTEFRLFIKHPAIFTALAMPLSGRLPLYAIVRHPLAVLASWQTVDIPMRMGRSPAAEAFAPSLRALLDSAAGPLDRQVELLRWHFQVYQGLPRERVLTYESLVQNPSESLAHLSGAMATFFPRGRVIDPRVRYRGVDFAALATALFAIEADVEPFYPNFVASLHAHLAAA